MFKLAISAELTQRLLGARIGQGARVAPSILDHVGSLGGAVTPAPLRSLALNAGADVRAARAAEQFAAHPVPAARRAGAEAVTGLEHAAPERMFQPGPVGLAEVPHATPEKTQMLFPQSEGLVDPHGLMQAPTAPVVAPTVAARPPKRVEQATVASKRPRGAAALAEKLGAELNLYPKQMEAATNTDGRLVGQIPRDPGETARTAFEQNSAANAMNPTSKLGQTLTAKLEAPFALFKVAGRRLHGRTKFRGLEISIENREGSHRHWYDPHAKEHGKTKMQYPYGYIRRTMGMDGDHVDVFVGPNEEAAHVYVVLTRKAPDFKSTDEEKCMLGFDSLEAAKAAFHAHYTDSRFCENITEMPFDDFKKKVLATFDGRSKKVATHSITVRTNVLRSGLYTAFAVMDKLAGDPGTPFRENLAVTPHFAAGGQAPAQFNTPNAVTERPRGLAPPSDSRTIIGEPASLEDRIDKGFRYMDQGQNTTAVEGAWGHSSAANSAMTP